MSQGFQYSLRALLLFMLVVAAFFGGMAIQRQLDKPVLVNSSPTWLHSKEKGILIQLPQGDDKAARWHEMGANGRWFGHGVRNPAIYRNEMIDTKPQR